VDRALCSPKSIYLAARPANLRNIPVDQDPQIRHSSFLFFQYLVERERVLFVKVVHENKSLKSAVV
jgi:hypothetical protein